MKRREFIKGSLIGLTLPFVPSCSFIPAYSKKRNLLAIAWAKEAYYKIHDVEPLMDSHLVLFDPLKLTSALYKVPFKVHTVLQNPIHDKQLILIPKWGQHLAVLNFESGNVERLYRNENANNRFFGHGVWDKRERGFWVSEQNDSDKKGYLVLRDMQMKTLRVISSGGHYPHDVQFDNDGLLVVANSGHKKIEGPFKKGNLAWLNPLNGEVQKRVDIFKAEEPGWLSHYIQIPSQKIIYTAGVADTKTKLSSVKRVSLVDQSVESLTLLPDSLEDFKGESLSIDYMERSNQIVWSCMDARKRGGLLKGDVATNQMTYFNREIKARGIYALNDELYFTDGESQSIWKETANQRIQLYDASKHLPEGSWGSHFSVIKI